MWLEHLLSGEVDPRRRKNCEKHRVCTFILDITGPTAGIKYQGPGLKLESPVAQLAPIFRKLCFFIKIVSPRNRAKLEILIVSGLERHPYTH